jgi:hypothetical protein
MYEVTFTHDYHGEITLAGTASEILRQAMQYDHPCDDTTGCDVANMVKAGYLLIATDRMFGATECPTLEAAVNGLPESEYNRALIEADENAWWSEVSPHAVYCPECNTLLYGQDVYLDPEENLPNYCTNCAHGFDPATAERPRRVVQGTVISSALEIEA